MTTRGWQRTICAIVLALAGVLSGPPSAATEEVFAPDACPAGIPCLEATITLAHEPGEAPTVEHLDDPDERRVRRPEFKGLNPETDMSEEGPDWILKIEGSNVTGYLFNGGRT